MNKGNILSIRVNARERSEESPWSAEILVTTEGLRDGAMPFMARIGRQLVRELIISPEGDFFSGFLPRAPQSGDRLFVGYGSPEIRTSLVYGANQDPPLLV